MRLTYYQNGSYFPEPKLSVRLWGFFYIFTNPISNNPCEAQWPHLLIVISTTSQ